MSVVRSTNKLNTDLKTLEDAVAEIDNSNFLDNTATAQTKIGDLTINGALKEGVNRVIADAGKSLTTNGYQKLSNGLIFQWGYVNPASTSTAVTFPIAFPTTCLNVNAITDENVGYGAIILSKTSTTVTVDVFSANYDFYWFALGY